MRNQAINPGNAVIAGRVWNSVPASSDIYSTTNRTSVTSTSHERNLSDYVTTTTRFPINDLLASCVILSRA